MVDPVFTPLSLRGTEFRSRIAASPAGRTSPDDLGIPSAHVHVCPVRPVGPVRFTAHAFERPRLTLRMSSDAADRDRDRDEELPELLDDLETTLADLRSELRREPAPDRRGEAPSRTRRDRAGRRSDLPRPPSVSDLLGFTEQYTLPTLIATLEAAIRALELLQGTLRLVNPDRSAVEPADRGGDSSASRLGSGAAGVGRGAVSGVERALSELETALAASDAPNDRASDELLGEVRDLSAEVRARLDAARDAGAAGQRDAERAPRRDPPESTRDADGVAIEVTGSDDGDDPEPGNDRGEEDRPEVDVEAELESIRHEVRGTDGADSEGEESEDAGAGPGDDEDAPSSAE